MQYSFKWLRHDSLDSTDLTRTALKRLKAQINGFAEDTGL